MFDMLFLHLGIKYVAFRNSQVTEEKQKVGKDTEEKMYLNSIQFSALQKL